MVPTTLPARAHLHVLISNELMLALKDAVYLRTRAGERITQQDLVTEILQEYFRGKEIEAGPVAKSPRHASGCKTSA